MPKSLITGGAGFIGSHLAELLLGHGRELVIVDDLSTGRLGNIEHLLRATDRCRFVQARVSKALAAEPSLFSGVDEVYHLAAAVGVKLVVDDPFAMIRNNVDETAMVLDAAATVGASVLIASSSEVYGKGVRMPLSEEQDLVYGPTTASRWSYAMSKALDEHLALAHRHKHGLGVVIARFFNTIGPRQVGRYGMVVPRFVKRAVEGQDLEIYGDGKQTRAFCDVRDVVRAVVALLGDKRHHGQVFNVGADRELSIDELADLVIRLAGEAAGEPTGSKKRYLPYEQAYDAGFEDPARRVPDLKKIRAAIGFERKHTLEQTVAELIALARHPAPSPSGRGLG
jgi:UDP-glucose 4-epimerase